MESLTHQRCLNHALREAVARCPWCRQFYCRECITEHEDRVICAVCLKKISRPAVVRRFRLVGLLRAAQCLLGLLAAWIFFYSLGRGLLALPSSFHDGTIWNVKPLERGPPGPRVSIRTNNETGLWLPGGDQRADVDVRAPLA